MTIEEIADQIVDAVFAEKVKRQAQPLAKPLVKSEVKAIVKDVLQRNLPHLVGAQAVRKSPLKKPMNAMTEPEFIAFLEDEPTLQGVDVKREIGKCQFWCRANGAAITRRRIFKWLQKADRPVAFNGAGMSSRPTERAAIATDEPEGWRDWVKQNAQDPSNADKPWSSFDRTAQNYIRTQMTAAPSVH